MSKRPTKERILDAAEGLMLEQSFHSVSVSQILTAVKVPKGSFYHYFESKEQFGVEMLRHYIAHTSARKRAMLLSSDDHPDPIDRLFAYLDGGVAFIGKSVGTFPCLILKLASEIADLSVPMRDELSKGLADWIAIFQQLLDEAVAQKRLPESVDTAAAAQLIHDLWSGATQRSVINHSTDPIQQAVHHIKSHISAIAI